jgi:hypothetical protein
VFEVSFLIRKGVKLATLFCLAITAGGTENFDPQKAGIWSIFWFFWGDNPRARGGAAKQKRPFPPIFCWFQMGSVLVFLPFC